MGVPSILEVLLFVCLFGFRWFFVSASQKGFLQHVEVSAASSDQEGDLQGPNKLVCHDVVGEEGHEVINGANGVDGATQKGG